MKLVVNDSIDSFESWLSREYIPNDLKQSLSSASILIVPIEDLRENVDLAFPVGTSELFQYFKENLPTDLGIDICIRDEDYQEFAFFSDYKRYGKFFVKSLAVPVFVTVLSAYITYKVLKEDKSKPQIEIKNSTVNFLDGEHISNLTDKKYLEPTHISFSVTIEDTLGNTKNISYDGPAENVDEVFKTLKEYED